MILGKILAEEGHQTPGKVLAGDDNAPRQALPGTTARHDKTLAGPPGKALTEDASRATARPMLAKTPPLFACSCRPNQLGRHLRGNMQPFVEAPPPRHLSCLPAYMAPQAPLARARVDAKGIGDGQDWALPRPR